MTDGPVPVPVPVRLGLLVAIRSILPPGPERSELDRTLETAAGDPLFTFNALLALAEAVDNVIDTAATSVTKSLAAGYYRELTAIAAAHARDAAHTPEPFELVPVPRDLVTEARDLIVGHWHGWAHPPAECQDAWCDLDNVLRHPATEVSVPFEVLSSVMSLLGRLVDPPDGPSHAVSPRLQDRARELAPKIDGAIARWLANRAESANPAGEVPIAPVPGIEDDDPSGTLSLTLVNSAGFPTATERANPRITRISFGTDTAEIDYEDTPDLDDDEDDVVDVCDWLDRLATRLGDHLTAGDRRHLAALRSYLDDQNSATVKAELDPLDHLPTRDGDLLRLADGPDGEGVVIATHVRRIDSRLNRGEGPPTITVSAWPFGDPEDIDFVTVSFPTPDAADAYFRRLVALIPDTKLGASIAAQLDNTPPAVTPEPVDAGPRPDSTVIRHADLADDVRRAGAQTSCPACDATPGLLCADLDPKSPAKYLHDGMHRARVEEWLAHEEELAHEDLADPSPAPSYPRRAGDKIELSEHFTARPADIEEYGARPDNDPSKAIVFVAVRARPGHGPARYYLPPAPVAEARRYLDDLRDLITNPPAPAAPPAGTDLTRIFAELMARRFHEAYERLAPTFGYETRPESAVPWDQVPEQNRELMVAVCAELLGQNTAGRPLGDDR